ncbi:hypothetical protein F4803DRAFT_537366 [Xylaria telfairii]|nr:hypothetical protein F4803DRAFT_537366 [Xylaria telfairii]
MSNLPSQHPSVSLHLTDRALTPLITSARDPDHLSYLTSLTQTAQAAYESAQRLGLGPAQRIMVEHGEGPVLLQTYLSPIPPASRATTPPTNGGGRASRHSPSPHQGALALAVENRNNTATPQPTIPTTTAPNLRGGADDRALFLGRDDDHLDDDDDDDDDSLEENPDAPPMLFGIVVAASADDTLEARRAAVRLERVGREIQSHWAELQQGQRGRPDERQGPDAAAD